MAPDSLPAGVFVRIAFVFVCLLVGACGSQAPAPEISTGTAPEGRRVSSAWECDPKSAGLWNCKPAQAPAANKAPAAKKAPVAEEAYAVVTDPESPIRDESAPMAMTSPPVNEPASPQSEAQPTPASDAAALSPGGDSRLDLDGSYVLQVGAFRTEASARAAADTITGAIDSKELQVIATRRGVEEWYVLVLGSYDSKVDAREAGEVYLDAHPGGSIWVRSAADLRDSLVNP
jgi:septal ring-binding cell division protein DamX